MRPVLISPRASVIGAPEPQGRPLDIGAEKTFDAPELKAGFKVPTLRNIDRTAPYMHSGAFDNLHAIAEFYNGGRGHAVPEGIDLQLHWHISSPDLTDYELDRLVDAIREACSQDDLIAGVTTLASMLRKDIEQEERDYVTEKILRDNVIPSDTFGG